MCKIISDSIEELDRLVEASPRCIPLAASAEFLGMTPETLRTSISQGKCTFGVGWTSDKSRGVRIPTIPFYLFVTQGHIL